MKTNPAHSGRPGHISAQLNTPIPIICSYLHFPMEICTSLWFYWDHLTFKYFFLDLDFSIFMFSFILWLLLHCLIWSSRVIFCEERGYFSISDIKRLNWWIIYPFGVVWKSILKQYHVFAPTRPVDNVVKQRKAYRTETYIN